MYCCIVMMREGVKVVKQTFINIIKVASVYAGAILGAGFASGQEILQFFMIYGKQSVYGIMVSTFLFCIIGVIVLNKIYHYNISSYTLYIVPLMGKKMGKIIEMLVCIFMLTSFCVMVAGSGAIFQEELKMAPKWGIVVMAVICLIVFCKDIKGVIIVNSILAPIMMIGMILMGSYILLFRVNAAISLGNVIHKMTFNWFSSSLIYVSYNTLTIVVVMTALLPLLTKRCVAIWGGLLGGMSLGLIAFLLSIVMRMFYADILSYEIPILQIMIKYGKTMEWIYVSILYGAMFTTAVASGYGFLNRITEWFHLNYKMCAVGLCIFSIPFASIGFVDLIKVVYPLFGHIGILIIGIILADGLKGFAKTLIKVIKLHIFNLKNIE